MISGNMVGMYSSIGKTITLVDADGNELAGVIVGQETKFTATDNDVRIGSVYASDSGVSVGTKVIPTYHTYEGSKIITAGSKFTLEWPPNDTYDYTKLQCIICPFNSSFDKSVAAEKVVIADNLYNVNSTVSISLISKDSTNKAIDFGITNNTSTLYIIRYLTYREIE